MEPIAAERVPVMPLSLLPQESVNGALPNSAMPLPALSAIQAGSASAAPIRGAASAAVGNSLPSEQLRVGDSNGRSRTTGNSHTPDLADAQASY